MVAGKRGTFVAALFVLLIPHASHAVDVKAAAAPAGAEVWIAPDHTQPMIAVEAALPAGSAYDPPGKSGLANFAAQMLDEGAGQMNSSAFQTALGDRAIRLSVTMERDYLVVSLVTLSANAKDAFALLGQALAHPRFDADAMVRTRAQILAGIADREEDPQAVAENGFFRIWYRDSPYAHPVEGDASGVGRIGAADLRRFAKTHWVAHGLRVAIAGDFNEDALPALLTEAFGALPATSPRLPAPTIHPGGSGLTLIGTQAPQSAAVFGLPGVVRSDPDYLPAYVANYILGGGGFASRLTEEVREERGLTYDISTSLESWRRTGLVIGDVSTRRDAMKQTLAAIRRTLRTFSQNGPTDAELADAKTYLTGSYPLSFASDVDVADQLNAFERVGLSIDYVRNRNALVNAVTMDQVKRAARRLFDPARLGIVVAGGLGARENGKAAAAAP